MLGESIDIAKSLLSRTSELPEILYYPGINKFVFFIFHQINIGLVLCRYFAFEA
jgi:hypothetical protein